MLDLAGEHKWAEVEAMEHERRLLLERQWAEPVSIEQKDGYVHALQQILEINREILTLGKIKRQRMLKSGIKPGAEQNGGYLRDNPINLSKETG
jgi:hypothetical protein